MTATATNPTSTTVTTAELKQLIAGDADTTLIDVRTGSEFETAHIPGSFHLPIETMKEHAGRFADLDGDVILVCQSGNRASQAESALSSAGARGVRVLSGGIGSWIADGGEVRRGEEKWAMDRQVRLAAGSLVLTGFALGRLVDRRLVGLSAAVGGGLVFSALSNTCAMGTALGRLPYNQGAPCDVDAVVAAVAHPQASNG